MAAIKMATRDRDGDGRRGEGMRLFNRNKLQVIFLVPVAVAMSDSDGCSSTPPAEPLTATQISDVLTGNTVTDPDQTSFALVLADGSLRGRDTPNGGTVGDWRVSDNGVLCATWTDVQGGQENCDVVRFTGDKQYSWGGRLFMVIEGNPQNL